MSAKIAVATVSIDRPQEPVPIEVKVVITTEAEKRLIDYENVLAFGPEIELAVLMNEALQIVQGKEYFERVTIGVDPGEVFGLAVLAGGRVIETGNCFSLREILRKIETVVHSLEDTATSSISVKIGDGVPECTEKLLRTLDKSLPSRVVLESVREAGTDSRLNEAKHRRGLRDIGSAIQIAGRSGQVFHRRKPSESYD